MDLKKALEQLNKTYGENSVNRLGDMGNVDIAKFSSGSYALDLALGGGFPVGKIVEIYGPESSGKTTLTLHAICEIQKLGKKAAMIDMEHAFDKTYAENLGIDCEDLILSQPECAEQAFDITDVLIETGELGIIVIDSVSALIPKRQLEGEFGDSVVGLQAKLMSTSIPKILGKANKFGVTIIFINQIRENVGVMFGSPETTSGGRALKFYASQRIDIRRKGQIKDGEEIIASETKIKVVKNKVAPPFREALTQIRFGKGIYKMGELLSLCVQYGIIEKNGAWFRYQDTNIGQGQPKTLDMLEDNPDLVDELKEQLETIINQ